VAVVGVCGRGWGIYGDCIIAINDVYYFTISRLFPYIEP
jgi:hypothetical protein